MNYVWRPGYFLFAIHSVFTWVPRIHWQRHWRSVWWLWFEISRAEPEPLSRQNDKG